MSLLRTKGLQIGQDGTATNNFTLYQPGVPDGTLRIGNGNNGSVTDAITVNSSGKVGIGTSSPSSNLHVQTTGANASITIQETSSAQYAQYLRLQDSTTSWYVANRYANTGSTSSGFGIGTTASGDYLQIDTSGRVTTPNQPAFMAVKTTSQTGTPFVVTGYTSVTNIGNHFNTSTGIFTAPVSGVYQFTFSCIGAGNLNHSNDIYGYLNGARNQASLAVRPTSTTNSYASMGSNTVLISLSANDTFGILVENGTTLYGDTNAWVRFSGRLIG